MFPSFSSVDLSSKSPKTQSCCYNSGGKSVIFEKFLDFGWKAPTFEEFSRDLLILAHIREIYWFWLTFEAKCTLSMPLGMRKVLKRHRWSRISKDSLTSWVHFVNTLHFVNFVSRKAVMKWVNCAPTATVKHWFCSFDATFGMIRWSRLAECCTLANECLAWWSLIILSFLMLAVHRLYFGCHLVGFARPGHFILCRSLVTLEVYQGTFSQRFEW